MNATSFTPAQRDAIDRMLTAFGEDPAAVAAVALYGNGMAVVSRWDGPLTNSAGPWRLVGTP